VAKNCSATASPASNDEPSNFEAGEQPNGEQRGPNYLKWRLRLSHTLPSQQTRRVQLHDRRQWEYRAGGEKAELRLAIQPVRAGEQHQHRKDAHGERRATNDLLAAPQEAAKARPVSRRRVRADVAHGRIRELERAQSPATFDQPSTYKYRPNPFGPSVFARISV
jgi:hypothetical protein